MTDPSERALLSLRNDLDIALRRNKIAAIVTDTCREQVQVTTSRLGEGVVPVEAVQEMLSGILAALAGATDWSELHVIHPDVTPLAMTRIQALLDGPRLLEME